MGMIKIGPREVRDLVASINVSFFLQLVLIFSQKGFQGSRKCCSMVAML